MSDGTDDKIAAAFAREALREQRLSRRWNTFFKFLFFFYLVAIMLVSMPNSIPVTLFAPNKITALVELEGVISADSRASADAIVRGLRAAFKDKKTAGVILRINSPGGSPVQAGLINDEIYRLKEKYPKIPFYAVIQDICASGGYYVAAAADEIYADKSSLVGSIGVRMGGFGFVDSMEKLGVERRLLTAGKNKGFLDPFLPLKPEEVQHVTKILDEIHSQFINTVRKGRGDKLADSDELFTGFVWTGERGLALGLVDALGSAGFVAREIIGAEKIVNFTPQQNLLDQFARKVGASIAEKVLTPELGLR